MSRSTRPGARKGRGAAANPPARFDARQYQAEDDGWPNEEGPEALSTELVADTSRSIISHNDSPDVPFDRSINPYRGCEHGCIYCFARPSHAYLGYSPGLEFESRILYKPGADALLRRELSHRGYRCRPLALGANTDAYQPAERQLGLTRKLLEVLLEYRHPVVLITKSALIERDSDLLAALAKRRLVQVMISFTSLDSRLARTLEPRAAAPRRRLECLRRLTGAGVPCGLLLAPLIPGLCDQEMETILAQAKSAGAGNAGYILLRLPLEVRELFHQWLQIHYPERAQKVINQLRACRGGRDYDPSFEQRMTGSGPLAQMLADRFRLASRRFGLGEPPALDCSQFRVPTEPSPQLNLF